MSEGNGSSVTLDLPAGPVEEEFEAPAGPPQGSVLADLRRRREELRAERETVIDIQGYDGLLGARYKPIPYEKLQAIQAKAEKAEAKRSPYAVLNGQLDTLIEGCEEIVARATEDEPWAPLDADEPVKFETRLGDQDLFGFPANTAREAVRGLFPSEIAIGNHYVEFVRWLEGTDTEVDEDLAGE